MRIILVNPEIPQNTGNIARTCAASGTQLVLVRPLGFSISNRQMKRAGLDYWELLELALVDDLQELLSCNDNFFFFSSKAERRYTDVSYTNDSSLIFGSETAGLPSWLWEAYPERFVTIPMLPERRCLNLASSVAIGLYEALRQNDFNAFERQTQEWTGSHLRSTPS